MSAVHNNSAITGPHEPETFLRRAGADVRHMRLLMCEGENFRIGEDRKTVVFTNQHIGPDPRIQVTYWV